MHGICSGKGKPFPERNRKKIRTVDKNRSKIREIMTDSKWGDKTAYHLVINTTDWDLKELASSVKVSADCWFQHR